MSICDFSLASRCRRRNERKILFLLFRLGYDKHAYSNTSNGVCSGTIDRNEDQLE